MRVTPQDHRSRWIVIGGVCGACTGVPAQHLPIAVALGIAVGMGVGAAMNRMFHM